MPARSHVFALLGLLAALPAPPALAAPRTDLVRAELVPEVSAVRPGEPFTVGVRLVMKPGWHTYWRNPGDSGLPTEIAWTLPAGFGAGPIAWPAPQRMPVADFMNFGYAGETTLLVTLTPPTAMAPGSRMPIRAELSYLVCERECIPGKASLAATLPVAAPGEGEPDPARRDLFEAARTSLPVPLPWPQRTVRDGDGVRLVVAVPNLRAETIRDVAFFPYDGAALDHAAEQPWSADPEGLSLRVKPAAGATPPERLDGVLTVAEATGDGTVTRAFAVGREPAAALSAEVAPVRPPEPALPLWQAMLLALAGGLVLNLMPCVFPVLSIKVLALVRHAGEGRSRLVAHGLAYGAGTLATFLGLAGLLMGMRAAGSQVGWGYQLQSPVVVAGLAFLMLAVGLSLSGVFHLGGRIVGLGDGLARRGGLVGSFFTGALAAVVATPCTAPFMGAAVGFALTQPPALGLGVFAALGLGLALPFVLLAATPGLVRLMPRPGPWMAALKGALAFPVYGTAAWLVWVVSRQVGPAGLFATLGGLVLVGFAAWCLGQSEAAGPGGRRAGLVAATIALAALALPMATIGGDAGAPATAARDGSEPYSEARLAALRAEGRPVLVNLTAAWCITCLVNERTALDTAAVRAALAERGVAVLVGDWTNQDAAITAVLERHGRSGVPLTILHPPGREPVVLPQILTESRVLAEIAALPRPGGLARAPSTP